SGKSLCYQLPGALMPGTTLVISPLIALMQNQVKFLDERGLAAGLLHGGFSKEQSRAVCLRYKRGELKFLFIAPERLGHSGFANFLRKYPPNFIVIDEAHCIS